MAILVKRGYELNLLGFIKNTCIAEDEHGNLWVCEYYHDETVINESRVFFAMRNWYFVNVENSSISKTR